MPPRGALRENALPALAYALVAVVLGSRAGQDLNWDLLNYHFYDFYMLAGDHFDWDVHVAGIQTFLNPLVDAPFYAAFRFGVPPRIFFSALAAFHGLTLLAVHRIAGLLMPPSASTRERALAGVLAAATAAAGAGFRSEVGNTMHDATLAFPVLAALWLLLARTDERSAPSRRALAGAGLLAGLAAGMKLALGPLCVGLTAAVASLRGGVAVRLGRVTTFVFAVALGVAITGGWWMLLMDRHFESPLFPFFNEIFRSPFAPIANVADERFLPRTLVQQLFYPFFWIRTTHLVVTEPAFRDARFAAAFVAIAALGVNAALRRSRPPEGRAQARRLWFVVVFWSISYAVWLQLFSIYRYALVLEALAGVLVVAAAAAIAPSRTWRFALAAVPCAWLIAMAKPPDWGRTAWSDSYFGVDREALRPYAGATLLMTEFPQGHLPPHFPASARFVRVASNWGLTTDTKMWTRMVEAIRAAPDGKLFLLEPGSSAAQAQQASPLAPLGLERSGEPCARFASHDGGFRICPLRRRAP